MSCQNVFGAQHFPLNTPGAKITGKLMRRPVVRDTLEGEVMVVALEVEKDDDTTELRSVWVTDEMKPVLRQAVIDSESDDLTLGGTLSFLYVGVLDNDNIYRITYQPPAPGSPPIDFIGFVLSGVQRAAQFLGLGSGS